MSKYSQHTQISETQEMAEDIVKILKIGGEKGNKYIQTITEGIDDDEVEEGQKFRIWLKKNRILTIPFYLAVLLTLIIIVSEVFIPKEFREWNKTLIFTFEGLAIFFIIANITLSQKDLALPLKNDMINRANNTTNQFLDYWRWLWISWFGLYLILILMFSGFTNWPSVAFDTLIDSLNNLSAIMFTCMYYELARDTQTASKSQVNNPKIMLLIILIILALLESIVLGNFSPESNEYKKYHFYFSLFSGVTTGVLMGLFFKRLETVFFKLPLPLIIYFTLYAVIQPTSIFIFSKKNDIEFLQENDITFINLGIWMIAFYAKTFLFLIISWLRDTMRLHYYMVREYRLLADEAKNKREVFLKIVEKLNADENVPEIKKVS